MADTSCLTSCGGAAIDLIDVMSSFLIPFFPLILLSLENNFKLVYIYKK